MDDVQIETADITHKFKFFETYKPVEPERKQFRITPPRDGVATTNDNTEVNGTNGTIESNENGLNGSNDLNGANGENYNILGYEIRAIGVVSEGNI